MKVKSQVNGKKKKSIEITVTTEKDIMKGVGVIKNGDVSKKKQYSFLQRGNKIINEAAKVKSGTEFKVVATNSLKLDAKDETNPIHPLFLRNKKKNVGQVLEVSVVSTPGKQKNKKNSIKKKEISGKGRFQKESKTTGKVQENKTQQPGLLTTNIKVSPAKGIKIQFKKKNKKKKSKGAKQQNGVDNESAIPDKIEVDLPESLSFTENDGSAESSEEKELFKSKNGRQNKNKKLKLEVSQLEKTDALDSDITTIFVGNLPNTVKKEEIGNLFKKYGKILSIRLRSAAPSDQRIPKKVAIIKRDFHADTDNINAFVTFEEKFEARNALIANGSVFSGHHIRVDYAKPEKQLNNRVAIFVGNLPFAVRDDELWETFQNCGEIESVRVVRDKDTRMGKGFGYVNFKSPDGVELALQLEDVKIQKRKLRIARASEPKAKHEENKNDKPRKRKLNAYQNEDDDNDDSIVEKKKVKYEITKLNEDGGKQEQKKKQFQGEKSAARRLKKQTLKKKVKKMRNEKHKKSVANFLTSKSGKGLKSKNKNTEM